MGRPQKDDLERTTIAFNDLITEGKINAIALGGR